MSAGPDHIALAKQGAAHLREEANFNRHLAHMHRQPSPVSAAYAGRRREITEQYEQWAEANRISLQPTVGECRRHNQGTRT